MNNIDLVFEGKFSIIQIANGGDPLFRHSGVYLWTLPHKANNYIVYVGETGDFQDRFCKYKKHFEKEKEYFVLPDIKDNLYDLLKGDSKEFYYDLYEHKKFWYPGLVSKPDPWVSEYSQLYRDKLEIYLLVSAQNQEIKLNENERESLQTQIQKTLRIRHDIKYYDNTKDQCWLGKEDPQHMFDYNFRLNKLPEELDEISKETLNDLSLYVKKFFRN